MNWEIDHIQLAIPAGGEDRARAFWVQLLGLVEFPKPDGLKGRGGLWLLAGGLELHLGVDPDFKAAGKAHPCFRLPDLAATAALLTNAGFAVLWDDKLADRPRFFSADPFGNRLEFT